MKKIGDFLFVEQCFTDTEETKTAVVNINYIDSITQSCNDKLGDIVVIETDNAKIICKDPENFFTEFENLISDSVFLVNNLSKAKYESNYYYI